MNAAPLHRTILGLRFRAAFNVAVAVVFAILAPVAADGQQASNRRMLVRQMYGDVAIEVLLSNNGLRIGAADDKRVISIGVMPRDLLRWTDSATRILAARGRVRDQDLRWRATIEEPGVDGGSMTLTRSMTATDTTISLFISDTQFEGIRTAVEADEARTLVAALRRAANVALNPPKAARPPPSRPSSEEGKTSSPRSDGR